MDHKLKDVSIQNDVTIRLIFEGGSWATMTFVRMRNDWTNVSITSDWGNWNHGWSDSGIKSYGDIYGFMSSKSNLNYLRGKFIGAEKLIFDNKATCKSLRKLVRDEYPWISHKETNSSLMKDIKALEGCETDQEFLMAMTPELDKFFAGEAFRCLEYSRLPRTDYFFREIFPQFLKHIAKISKTTAKVNKAITVKLTKEQLSILDHTVNRAARGMYAGGGSDMEVLTKAGFMVSHGKCGVGPDEYFSITNTGKEYLEFSK